MKISPSVPASSVESAAAINSPFWQNFFCIIAFVFAFMITAKYGLSLSITPYRSVYKGILMGGTSLILLIMVSGSLFYLWVSGQIKSRALMRLPTFFLTAIYLYLMYVLASFLWTRAPQAGDYLFIWVYHLMELTTFALLCIFCDPTRLLKHTCTGFILGTLLTGGINILYINSVVPGFMDYTFRTENQWRLGDCLNINPNVLGYFCGISALSAMYVSLRARFSMFFFWLVLFMISLLFLIMTFAKTCITAFVLSFLLFIFSGGVHDRTVKFRKFIYVAFAFLVFVFNFNFIYNMAQSYVSSGDLATFSDRTERWNIAIKMIADAPIFGYGAANGLTSTIPLESEDRLQEMKDDPRAFSKTYNNPHSEYLTVWLQGGLVGLLLMFSVFASVLWKAFFLKSLSVENMSLKWFFISMQFYVAYFAISGNELLIFYFPMAYLVCFAFALHKAYSNQNSYFEPKFKKPFVLQHATTRYNLP